jgi:hypothetical protein
MCHSNARDAESDPIANAFAADRQYDEGHDLREASQDTIADAPFQLPKSTQNALVDIPRYDAVEGIRRGIEAMFRGQIRPAKDVFDDLAAKYERP